MIRLLLTLSRPRFWMYTAGPFLLGYISGLPAGYQDIYPPLFWVLLAYYLLPANVLIYGLNDLSDADTDALNAKKEAQEHRLAARERDVARLAVLFCGALSLAVLFLMPLTWWWLQGGFLMLGILYSAPPIRFKARPFVDSYANVFYVLPGFLGYALTAGTLPPSLMLIGAACWAAGMHAYSAIPDIVPDRAAGLQTVAVTLGARGTLFFVALNWLVFAAACIITLGWIGAVTLAYPLGALALLIVPRLSVERAYWWFPAINAGIGFLAFVWKMLIV